MTIKALTVYDPWASLIALGEKKIETRGWYTKYRGPLAIHAAKKQPDGAIPYQEPFYTALKPFHKEYTSFNDDEPTVRVEFPEVGCILAICNLVDCMKVVSIADKMQVARLQDEREILGKELVFGDYTPGRYAWILKDVHRLAEPIPAKGRQRIWNWDPLEHFIWFDPYMVGNDQIWTPQGILTGQVVPEGTEDAIQGLQIMGVVA